MWLSSAAASAMSCWTKMSSGACGGSMASSRPWCTAPMRASDSMSSSRVRGHRRPLGVPWRLWLERPTRWRKVAMLRGEPTWHTSSTGPMSMPSSSEAVATRALRSPALRRRSVRMRRSVDKEPWWAATASSPRRSASWWAMRSERRRVLTNTMVVWCWVMRAAMRSRIWSIWAWEATASSSSSISSNRMSRFRWWPVSTMARWGAAGDSVPLTAPAGALGMPVRRSAMRVMGCWVADRPMRVGRVSATCSRRSRVRARWLPRLSRAVAWISSTITVSTVRSTSRLLAAVTSR